jgi:hypothetical protein
VPLELDRYTDLETTLDVVASLGPYVFTRGATSIDACGAHGSVIGRAAIVDVVTGRGVAALAPDEIAALRPAAERQVIGERGRKDDLGWTDRPDYATSEPTWRAGRRAFRHLFYAHDCYACSNGAWSDYT